jgi:hypothetical protein
MANQILYGFHNLQDLYNERVTEVGVDVVNTAIAQAVEEQNRQIDSLVNFFVQRTTNFKTRFQSVTGARLQPLDESGRALPIKPSGKYDVAFPIETGGTAWGYNYITGQKLTVGEVARMTQTMNMADSRWLRDKLLAALFTNTNRTFVDPEHGSLTVLPIANGDSQVYQTLSGADLGATSNHFLAEADAIADAANPYPEIYSTLMQHPENGGQVVMFISPTISTTTKNLANFTEVPDPNITPGNATATLTGSLGAALPGDLLGYVDGVWIVEWRSLPDNYGIAVTTEGDKPLAMREDMEASLRGFKQVGERNDHPWYERQYMRRAGFGAWSRAGALVKRFGNDTYAIPTGYTAPTV